MIISCHGLVRPGSSRTHTLLYHLVLSLSRSLLFLFHQTFPSGTTTSTWLLKARRLNSAFEVLNKSGPRFFLFLFKRSLFYSISFFLTNRLKDDVRPIFF